MCRDMVSRPFQPDSILSFMFILIVVTERMLSVSCLDSRGKQYIVGPSSEDSFAVFAFIQWSIQPATNALTSTTRGGDLGDSGRRSPPEV